MRKFESNSIRGLAVTVSALALLAGAPAYAQDQDDNDADGVATNDPGDDDISSDDTDDAAQQGSGTIVVTGSRLRRDDTYNSISPLQVLETGTLQDTGQFDAATILQTAESASGQQIDATFQGFVLNNGPGSQTLNLRGLGADRTLLLVNGRRLAPAGVEGAPTSPSINLLPSSLIARYDLLLDGASSVYGSDAVAGVGNIILRNDIDGIELFASGGLSEQGGGEDYTISGALGKVGSNWNVGIGAEYSRRGQVTLGDRDFLSGCDTQYEITDSGEIRTIDVLSNALTLEDSNGAIMERQQPCKITGASNRIIPNSTRFGSLYFDADGGNTLIPNFSSAANALGDPQDRDGDGFLDVDFPAVTRNGNEPERVFISPQDTYNVLAYGEYTFESEMNITPFFEAGYSRADVTVNNSGTGQFFPFVPASNQFNPCNISVNPNGTDCRAASNDFNLGTGLPLISTGFDLPVRPVVSIRGDRNNVATTQEQYRGVIGLRGDLPFIDDSWSFELSGVYSRSEGSSIRRGIREDRLALALGIDPTADFNGDGIVDNDGDGIADDYISLSTSPLLAGGACDVASLANPELAPADLTQGCVPLNLFAPSLFNTGGAAGDFATQAERDYLFGERTFDTTYEQTIANAFVTGNLIELPGGPLGFVLGAEYRNDTLNSQPDFVASNGLFWGFFADQGAQGGKDTYEAFGELDIPIISGERFFEDLRVNLSGRITDDEFYGTNETYSIKGGWQPVPALLIKGSYGTSFRAPNLRENFLAGQSGFLTLTDPCAVPQAAFNAATGGFDPAEETRDAATLDNCRREGRDPTRVGIDSSGLNTSALTSTEITSGGSFELDPETSTSITAGFSFAGFQSGIDINFNFNFYDIKVEGAIAEPTAQSIINDCFLRDDGVRSRNCDFITFNEDPTSRRLINTVFAGFINVNEEIVRGLDFNTNLRSDVRLFNEDVILGLNVQANHLLKRDTILLTDLGEIDIERDAGEFGFPSWTGRATFSANFDPFTITFQTRYIGPVEQQSDGIDELADAFGFGPDGQRVDANGDGVPDFRGDTCTGGGSRDLDGTPNGIVPGDGVFCRDVGFADSYFTHTISARYDADWFEVRVGVSNIFDESPPLVDSNEVFAISNTPIGNGYDLNGRRYFGSVSFNF